MALRDKKDRTNKPVARTPAHTQAPQVTVTCLNAQCAQYDEPQKVDAGVLLGDGHVLAMFAKFSCGRCGSDLWVGNTPRDV